MSQQHNQEDIKGHTYKKLKLSEEKSKITQSITDNKREEDSISSNSSIDQNTKNKLKISQKLQQRRDCPYLSTIKRHLLDFDFEKLCSISLNNLNVYACLVCGKYYQGRTKNTHAFIHSLENNHHVFINLHNTKIYCLPDNYEVIDTTLEDIKFNLKPRLTLEQIQQLDKISITSRALNGTEFIAGYVGLNNLKCTDYVNVMIQALCRVADFRDFFIQFESKAGDIFDYRTLLVNRTAELIRKIWNPKNFKGQVSPHELLQAITLKSNKKFLIGEQSDPIKLFTWYLDNLEKETMGIDNIKNIVKNCFRGEVEIHTFYPLKEQVGYQKTPIIEKKPFFILTMDIPPAPLYKEDAQKQTIPHQPIFNLLKKFDGETPQDDPRYRKIYMINKFPKYLILHLKRFVSNNFFMEKNPTIVSFPLNNLDMKQYLKKECINLNQNTKYNLLANICHEGQPKTGFYKIHVKNKALNQWKEIQDLHIEQIMPQLVCVSEAYIQIWERIDE